MGCCNKRKKYLLLYDDNFEDLYNYDINDDFVIYSREELFLFEASKARKLVQLLLNDDVYKYSKFLNKILSFNDNDFQKLFEGTEDYNYSQINEEEKIDFNFLVLKFDNYQCILQEWYRDEKKHKYIAKLWQKYITMRELRKKSSDQIERTLQDIYGFSNEEYKITEELAKIIINSPESKAEDIKLFLKEKRPDFYSLIDTASSYQKNLQNSSIKNKETYISNLEYISNKLISKLPPLVRDYFKNNENIKEIKRISEPIINRIKKELMKQFKNDSKAENDNDGFKKIYDIGYSLKTIYNSKILKGFKNYFDNDMLALSNLSMSFFNLCSSIITFYRCFEDYEKNRNEFSNRLYEIHNNFERHKNEIYSFTDSKNTEEYIKNIIDVGNKISQDKQDVIDLITQIEDTILQSEKTKKKNIGSIIIGSVGFVFSLVGAVFTGGGTAIMYGIAMILNGANVAISSGNIVLLKKQLKDYKSIVSKANDEYKKINNEIESLCKLCEKLYYEHHPIEV